MPLKVFRLHICVPRNHVSRQGGSLKKRRFGFTQTTSVMPFAPQSKTSTPRFFARKKLGAMFLSSTLSLLAFSSATKASAADFVVNAETAAQGYEVANPWGDTVLAKRRLMQTVGLGVYNIQGAYKPGEADYSLVLRLRLDADFGINGHVEGPAETKFSAENGSRFVPGLQEAPLDLMYAYVEGRNLAKGWVGFRVGRQYVTDVLGFWSFDGGLLRLTTPYYVQVELYGGLEQRGGLFLSTSRYERQGIWRGSHRGFGQEDGLPNLVDFPSYQFAQFAPAFGAALESAGPSWIHGRFSYRRVYNTGPSITQQFPDPEGGYRSTSGSRLSQERLGYALDLNKSDLGGLKGGFSYDLYNQLVGTIFGGLEAYAGKRVTLGADFDYFVPTFDADSIWNWFTHQPITTITGRGYFKASDRFDISASGGVRRWSAEGNPDTFGQGQCTAAGLNADCLGSNYFDPSNAGAIKDFSRAEANRKTAASYDGLANVSGRLRVGSTNFSLRGMMQLGEQGRRAGGDLSARQFFDGGRFDAGARVSLYDWHDPLRPDRDATSFNYVLGAGFHAGSTANFRVEWEHNMNRLVGQRFRVLGLVDVLVIK